MELYHYTSVPLLHSILNEGISKGHFLLSNDRMLYGHCWYTSSPLPHGHGLPDGTEILTESEKDFARRADGRHSPQSVNKLHNKKQVRIKVDYEWLRKQETFSKLLQIHGEPSLYGKLLGVMGWVKPAFLSDAELRRWMKSPKLKHDTWFVHRGVLSPEHIIAVEFMEKPDTYVPYDFEKHGRSELERNGLYSISAPELYQLNLHAQNVPFTEGSVVIICPNPEATPAIVFRKPSGALVLTIQTGKYLGSEGGYFTDEEVVRLGKWTVSRSEHLMILWQKSKESWLRHNC